MTLEDLIYSRLCASEILSEQLAVYGDRPAVFYHTAPDDTDKGWGKKPQYPRMDFVVDMQSNPERHTNGIMAVNIWCSQQGIAPYELEMNVRNLFQDVFITPDSSPLFSLSWIRSDAFDFGGKYPETASQLSPNTQVEGLTLLFDVFAFPRQESEEPDPVAAMNGFIKAWRPEIMVIGADNPPAFWSVSEDCPAVYFRLASLRNAERTFAVTWMEGELTGHLFAPESVRVRWLKLITDTLSCRRRVKMEDGSPMFLQSAGADSSADALAAGQLRVRIRYGILRRSDAPVLLTVNRSVQGGNYAENQTG